MEIAPPMHNPITPPIPDNKKVSPSHRHHWRCAAAFHLRPSMVMCHSYAQTCSEIFVSNLCGNKRARAEVLYKLCKRSPNGLNTRSCSDQVQFSPPILLSTSIISTRRFFCFNE